MGFASQVWRGMLCSNCNVEQFCGNPSKPTYGVIKSIVDKVMVRFFYYINTDGWISCDIVCINGK